LLAIADAYARQSDAAAKSSPDDEMAQTKAAPSDRATAPQSAQEVEDQRLSRSRKPLVKAPKQVPAALSRIRADTMVGIGLSNFIALSIMITTPVGCRPSRPHRDVEPVRPFIAMRLSVAGRHESSEKLAENLRHLVPCTGRADSNIIHIERLAPHGGLRPFVGNMLS